MTGISASDRNAGLAEGRPAGGPAGRPADRRRLKVFITSCETGEGAWTAHAEKLQRLYELSDKKHLLTEDPDSADIILVGNVREENWGRKILRHELINRHPDKSFSLSDADHPLILHHGIYASGVRSLFNLARIRTGSYTLYYDAYLNPYVRAHMRSEAGAVGKEYLLSFVGRNTFSSKRFMKARSAIFNLRFRRPDVFIEDSSAFVLWASQRDTVETLRRQRHYYDVLVRSKFSLCPRGEGAGTLRLFESMQVGVAPVIVSDRWLLPRGPKWGEFSILVKEKHVGEVERIVEAHEAGHRAMGTMARQAFDTYFSERVYFNYVVDTCADIMCNQMIPEALCWRLNGFVIWALRAREQLRSAARLARSGARRVYRSVPRARRTA